MSGPTARDYYLAARYYRDSGNDLVKAKEYITKANQMDAKYWQLRLESLVHGDLKDYSSAIAAAEKSMVMAETAGNMDYVKMNKKSIDMWKEMMAKPKSAKSAKQSAKM